MYMLNCPACDKQLSTSRGLASHWKQVHDPNRSIRDLSGSNNPMYGRKGRNQYTELDWSSVPWESLNTSRKRQVLLREANYACTKCGFDKKREGGGVILEIDHIDGNHLNSSRENLRVLCPNCHALTPNFRNWGRTSKHKTSTRWRRENGGYSSVYNTRSLSSVVQRRVQ